MSESTILVLAFLVLFIIAFFIFNKPKKKAKPTAIKKDELIRKYEDEMNEIISTYKDDKEQLQIKKIEYLKKASHKLHNNIFFDEQEAKQMVQRLASL